MNKSGKSYWGGRISTVHLLVLTSLESACFKLKILFSFFSKQAALIRSTVLCLPPQLVFPEENSDWASNLRWQFWKEQLKRSWQSNYYSFKHYITRCECDIEFYQISNSNCKAANKIQNFKQNVSFFLLNSFYSTLRKENASYSVIKA